jgi:hypothetical protein
MRLFVFIKEAAQHITMRRRAQQPAPSAPQPRPQYAQPPQIPPGYHQAPPGQHPPQLHSQPHTQPQQAGYGQAPADPSSKITIAKAITLLSIRIGRLESGADGRMKSGGDSSEYNEVLQSFSQRLSEIESSMSTSGDGVLEQMATLKQSIMQHKNMIAACVKDKDFKKTLKDIKSEMKKLQTDIDCLTQSALIGDEEEDDEEDDTECAPQAIAAERSSQELQDDANVDEATDATDAQEAPEEVSIEEP